MAERDNQRRAFLEDKRIGIVGVPHERRGVLAWLTGTNGQEATYETLQVSPGSAESKIQTVMNLLAMYPDRALYFYGPEGVIRLEDKKDFTRVDILQRHGADGEIIVKDGFLTHDVAFRMGQEWEFPYAEQLVDVSLNLSLSLGLDSATHMRGTNPVLENIEGTFQLSRLDGILAQSRKVAASETPLANFGEQLPQSRTFYCPPQK